VLDDVTLGMFLAAKALDPTRPVLDASGYSHRVAQADIYDSHDYEQEIEPFQAHYRGLEQGQPYVNTDPPPYGGPPRIMSLPYGGQPFFVSEFGGAWWQPEAGSGEGSWGYGERVTTMEAWYNRFQGLCQALLGNPRMFGYCYTQLTDVFQEQNGIYTFDRRPKFDPSRLRAIQGQAAAIEIEAKRQPPSESEQNP
jgi:hypothetical protein